MSLLGNALFTTTQQNVLGLLYTQPERSFYTKEILRLTGMGVATIKRELDRMLAAGILTLTRIGNQHHYQANPECPIYEELLSIVRKTFGIVDVISSVLDELDSQIEFAFIYGSIAKGGETASSDIDLLLIGKNLIYGDMMELLIPVEGKLGRTINPTIYTMSQIKKRLRDKNPFLTKVMKQPKLWVKGSENDIKKFRQSG